MVLVAVQLSVLGSYLPPVFKKTAAIHPPQTIISLPVHTAVCRLSGRGRVGGAGGCPTIRDRIVSPAGVQRAIVSTSTPDDHFTAGPHCCVKYRAVGALVVLVAVQLSVLGLYLPPVFDSAAIKSTPDDHFTASPHCRVIVSGRGRIGRAGGCPTIRARIVSPAGVQGVRY